MKITTRARKALSADEMIERMNRNAEGYRYKIKGGKFTQGEAGESLAIMLEAWVSLYVVEKPMPPAAEKKRANR